MKWKSPICIALVIMAACAGGCVHKGSSDSNDTRGVKKAQEAYEKAFCRKDVKALAETLAPNVSYENLITGDVIEGKDKVVTYFQDHFRKFGLYQIEMSSDGVDFIEEGHAIEFGITTTSKEDGVAEKTCFRADYVQEKGLWLLQKFTESTLVAAPSHFEYLKELDWLTGRWEDQDDNVDIRSSWKWDKNKNFLVGHCTKRILNQKELDIRQIIAWDPAQKKIRSWVFDSDGGFGEGTWTREDGSWYVRMTFGLADGRRASATFIYKKESDSSYTFQATGRDIDGKILPNIGPFLIVKTEGANP